MEEKNSGQQSFQNQMESCSKSRASLNSSKSNEKFQIESSCYDVQLAKTPGQRKDLPITCMLRLSGLSTKFSDPSPYVLLVNP
jgi:hypothetical protein